MLPMCMRPVGDGAKRPVIFFLFYVEIGNKSVKNIKSATNLSNVVKNVKSATNLSNGFIFQISNKSHK